ncbi:hypothetical protein AB0K68_06085 [Streptomyces sp. NPDC050698]
MLFGIIVWFAMQAYDAPPRLADPAPTAPPSPGADGRLPVQYRASYDPNARILGVLAIVTPLLTTIVGFYFGQRVGEASGEVATVESRKKQERIARVLAESGDTDALRLLSEQGLIVPTVRPRDGEVEDGRGDQPAPPEGNDSRGEKL